MRRPSPVKAAVLASLPADGSPIGRARLVEEVQHRCPGAAVATITTAITDMVHPRYGIERVARGLYRRSSASVDR